MFDFNNTYDIEIVNLILYLIMAYHILLIFFVFCLNPYFSLLLDEDN